MYQMTIKTISNNFNFKLLISTLFIAAVFLILFFIFSFDANAAAGTCAKFGDKTQCSEFTLFDGFLDAQKDASKTMAGMVAGLVRNTFFILATIELCWSAAIWAIEKDNMSALGSELIQKIMFISFFFMLLESGPYFIEAIEYSFADAGTLISKFTANTSTDGIIVNGFNLILKIWEKSPFFQDGPDYSDGFDLIDLCFIILTPLEAVARLLKIAIKALIPGIGGIIDLFLTSPCKVVNIILHIPQIILAFIVTCIIAVVYAIAAFQFLCLKIESYVVIVAGMVFLGLGSSRWTSQYASKTLSHAVTIGFRMLVLLIALGFMQNIIDAEIGKGFEFEFEPLLRMMALAIFMMFVVMQAPDMAVVLLDGEGLGMSSGMTVSSAMRNIQDVKGGTVSMVVKAVSKVAQAASKASGSKGGDSARAGGGGAVKGLGAVAKKVVTRGKG